MTAFRDQINWGERYFVNGRMYVHGYLDGEVTIIQIRRTIG